MTRFLSLRRAGWALCALWAVAAVAAPAEQKFTTSQTLSTEASMLIRLLDEVQYNHASVHQSDFGEIVPDYMAALDGQHLFYLGSDKTMFMKRYDAKTIYANLAYLGNIDAAYEMYYTYEDRVKARVQWILGQLDQGVDLNTTETFAADRSKADWPATMADADDLWSKRLKFEVIGEILDKKTPDEARAEVRKRYQHLLENMSQTDGDDLAEMYLTAVTGLYDPHSNYFSAQTYEDFGIQMKQHLVGIGALLESKDEYCKVKELVPGGPADLGHQLKPDDKIVAVGDDGKKPKDIIGMRLRDIVSLIRGSKGTKVHLTVERAGVQGHKDIVITRSDVNLSAGRAHGAVFQVPDGDGRTVPIGVIDLPEFYGPADDPSLKVSASQDVRDLIRMMKGPNGDGIHGLVLDLRGNGGGFLGEAINVAGLFIPHGPVVQVRDNEGQVTVDEDDNSRIAWDGPMAVLENRFSASASEIVAGALQNYGRAIIIGDASTHGKGTVQTVIEMKAVAPVLALSGDKTGAAKITIQKFYLPNGSSTQLEGVKADIALPSIDDFLPIGESSLPHALIWDRIPSSNFNGQPLDSRVVDALKEDSLRRQRTLEEFEYMRRNIAWFKTREDEKLISLNLADREKEKAQDDAFKKQMEAERSDLAKMDYPYTEVRVAPAPPPRIKSADSDDDDPDELDTDSDSDQPYKVDVELKESLRIVDDAIHLGQDHTFWVANHAPLTVASTKS